jgi:hypothetical protein
LIGFLVAFFFIVLLSLGLDFDAAVPGFFFTAIVRSSYALAATGRAMNLTGQNGSIGCGL